MHLRGDEGKGPGVFLWDLRDEWALIQRGGDWRICNEMGPRPGNPSQNLDSGFLEEKKQVKMGKPKILAGLSWAGEGSSCSMPGIMTILPYDSSFILRLLLELICYLSHCIHGRLRPGVFTLLTCWEPGSQQGQDEGRPWNMNLLLLVSFSLAGETLPSLPLCVSWSPVMQS